MAHLKTHALRTDGPFVLRSGAASDWYLDARQTTFDGAGARLVGEAVVARLPAATTAIGGMTMGADPIAVAAAMLASPALRSFSIRKEAKDHGMGGRLVGPVGPEDQVVVVEDTTTTGSALAEAIEVLESEGVTILAALSLVDRSIGVVAERMAQAGVAYDAIVTPLDLGVS